MTIRRRQLCVAGAAGSIVWALIRFSASAQQAEACQRLAAVAVPNATITSAGRVEAGKFSPPAGRRGTTETFSELPAFCRITSYKVDFDVSGLSNSGNRRIKRQTRSS